VDGRRVRVPKKDLWVGRNDVEIEVRKDPDGVLASARRHDSLDVLILELSLAGPVPMGERPWAAPRERDRGYAIPGCNLAGFRIETTPDFTAFGT